MECADYAHVRCLHTATKTVLLIISTGFPGFGMQISHTQTKFPLRLASRKTTRFLAEYWVKKECHGSKSYWHKICLNLEGMLIVLSVFLRINNFFTK
jgi:hypothetical protein